jgi:hypothetical protein
MSLFRLNRECDDLSNAELVIARETTLEVEKHLESWLENSPWALAQDETILWIGRQTRASVEEKTIIPDLLGVDSEGNLVIVELKKGREPREVVAQLLEYAAWAAELSPGHIEQIAEKYFQTRGMSQGKTLYDAFSETFEDEEVPIWNRRLRLFVVAEEISPRVSSICRFLRMAYGMDISCNAVSTFQTESGEVLVNIETKVGEEKSVAPQAQRQSPSQWSGDKGTREVVREAVQEITGGDATKEFTQKEIFEHILKKYPDFNRRTAGAQIAAGCPNHGAYPHHRGDYKFYWLVRRGTFRLYNPETDGEER